MRLLWWLVGAAVLGGACWLRFESIDWGAPFVYHPDEHFVLQPALEIVRSGDPNPHFFQYPSLLIYLQAALVAVLRRFVDAPLESNYLVNGIGPWDALPSQWPFVLAGRLLVAASAVLTVALLARTGARLQDRATGWIAAALLAGAALHNQSSHSLTTDVPATAFVVACLLATAAQPSRWALAGAMAGLAAGTKYTAGMVLLVPLLAALEGGAPAEILSRWIRIGVAALAAFLLSTPYALLDAPSFWEGLQAQRQNYMAWKGQTGNLWWYLRELYDRGLGPAPALLAAAGALLLGARALLAARGGGRAALLLSFLLPPLPYVAWIASYPSRAERNLIVVLPFLCLWAALALRWAGDLVRPARLGAALQFAAVLAVLASVLPSSRAFNQRLRAPDTRTQALAWMRANVPRGAKVAREEYTPQLQRGEYDVTYVFSLARQPYERYLSERVEYLVASSNVYGRSLEPPYIGGEVGRAFYETLFGLPLVQEFAPSPAAGGPTIRVYRVPLPPEEHG